MWGGLRKSLENTAEMEWTHMAMRSQVLQRDIIGIMFGEVLLGPFDRGKVLLLEAGMYALVGMVISDAAQYLVYDFHHEVIHLQFAAGTAQDQTGNVEMQELRLRSGFVQGRMEVIIAKEGRFPILFQQRCIKAGRELKDGAFIGYAVRMGHRTFVAGLGDQYTTGIGIQRTPEHIEQKIALAYETDGECFAVLGFGRTAVHTLAFEIHDAVKARLEQRMNEGIHLTKLQHLLHYQIRTRALSAR